MITFETADLLTEIETLANELLAKYDLDKKGWTFEFSQKKKALGTCDYRRKRIVFSVYFDHLPMEQIKNTLLHEIAHALTPGHNHDELWKAVADSIGASPQRCTPEHIKTQAKPRYKLHCPTCNTTGYRHRLRTNIICGNCRGQFEVTEL